MSPQGVNELIEQLQTSGEADSRGSFTISAEKARDKLSLYALSDPRFYVLNLLAWAVSSGASEVEVQVDSKGLCFEHDGEPLDSKALAGLWNALLDPSQVSRYELAMALNAARSFAPAELSVECWSEGSGCRLQVHGEILRIETPQAAGVTASVRASGESPRRNRVVVKEPAHRAPLRWLFGPPEPSILRAHPHWGPARVVLNGQTLSQSLRRGISNQTVAWMHLTGQDGARLMVEAPSPDWAPACVTIGPAPGDGADFEAVLTLAPNSTCQNEGLQLIVNGLAFRRPAGLLGCFFASGVVRMDSLSKNLSHSDLTEDETYRTLLDELRLNVELLIVKRMESPVSLPPDMLLTFLSFSRELESRLQARGLWAAGEVVTRWSKEATFARDILNDGNWRAIRNELEALGHSPAADALETRLASMLRTAGAAQFRAGEVHLTVRHWERLVEMGQLRSSEWLDRESEQLEILRALCGISVDPQNLSSYGARKANLLRLLGRPSESLPLCLCAQTRAETLLAMHDFANAEVLLRHQLANDLSPACAEALSDLLAYAAPVSRSRLQEAFLWRERAFQQHLEQNVECADLLREDLAQLARAALPFPRFVGYLVAASTRAGRHSVADELEEARAHLRRGDLGALRVKTALLSAETKYAPDHPLVKVARVRAARILRETGRWREADDVLARGRLIASLHLDS